jgi:small neutral amino acid transporter SnatA (MarC family)
MPVPIAYITVMENVINVIIVSTAYLLGDYLTSIFNIGTSEIGGIMVCHFRYGCD